MQPGTQAAAEPRPEAAELAETLGSSPSPSPDPDRTLPYAAAARAPDLPQIPGYAIEAELGRGGMGVVYRARQLGLDRTVALKMIQRADFASAEQKLRFRIEAENAARVQHPNIVQVFEIGERHGQPYFALEFVEGGSLADWLSKNRATPGLAAHLTETLARAVHAAHLQGIVHRDLKPANILLGEQSASADGLNPKIADFGLAKREGAAHDLTGSGAILGTPSHMAPEQASGDSKHVGAAADQYALGVIFYQLLTGDVPFKAAALPDLFKKIVENEPESPAKRNAAVPLDLSVVCLKALAKEPAKRYPSAEAFADDLKNWRENRPIAARPATRTERVAKWCRRYPAVAALIVVSVFAALTASGLAWWAVGAERAAVKERDAKAEALAVKSKALERAFTALRSMTDEVVERKFAQGQGPLLAPEDRKFLREIIAQFDELAAIGDDAPYSRAARAEGRFRVGVMKHRLGELREAEAEYNAAEAMYRQLVAEFPDLPQHRLELAHTYSNRGMVRKSLGRLDAAQADYEAALRVSMELAAAFPGNPLHREAVAGPRNGLAELLRDRGRPADAVREMTAAIETLAALATEFPGELKHRLSLAKCRMNRGSLLAMMGRLPEAEQEALAVLAAYKQLAAESGLPSIQHELAGAHNHLAILQKGKKNFTEAEANYGAALAIHKRLAARYPLRPEHRQGVAHCHSNLAKLFADTSRHKEAENSHDAAAQVLGQLAADYPDHFEYQEDLADTHYSRGFLFGSLGRNSEAEAAYRATLPLYRRLAAAQPDQPARRDALAKACVNLALVLILQQKWPEARAPLLEGRPHHLAALAAEPGNPSFRRHYRNHLSVRTEAEAGSLAPAEAVAAAQARRDVGWDAPADALDAAGFLAKCVPVVADHAKLDAHQREEAARFYGDQAMKLLHEAIAKGFRDAAAMRSDKRLAPLRQREDFQQALRNLSAK